MEDSKVLRLFLTIFMVTVPAQCSYYCYYYYSYTYYTTRQRCYYYYDYYYNDSSQSSYSPSAGVIAGAVIGGIVGCVIICAVVSWVCQNLSITQPWSGIGVPSTARSLYHFKYTTRVPTNLCSGFFAINLFGRTASLRMHRNYCFKRC